MDKKINFAVVGLGHIGKRHTDLILSNPRANLVALVDSNTTVLQNVGTLYKVPIFSELKHLLESNLEIDVINICTPNGYHASQTIECLKKSKHVVCEKPMALNTEEAYQMIEASEMYGKKIYCVMQNRYSPTAVWLKSVFNQNLLGKINQISVQCYWNRDQRYYQSAAWRGTKKLDGGVLYTQFSHYLDTLFWLMGGDIKVNFAQVNNFKSQSGIEIEDSGTAVFEFSDGASCTFNFSTTCWDKNFMSSISIIAENGSLRVGGQYMDKLEYCHIKKYQVPQLDPALPPNDYGFYKGSASNHSLVIDNVIDNLQSDTPITATAYEGFRVVEMIESIYQQAYRLNTILK